MRFITLFLVLSMVVLMAEPGEAFFRHIVGAISRIFGQKQRDMADQQELDQRAFDRERAFA
uniref:Moronecidin n=1 Tax=Sebastiscus marmoratus TaxID=41446 RepID=A0A5C1K3L1_SEBMA|nr:moronecidin [Sebastiscus marmoratus]